MEDDSGGFNVQTIIKSTLSNHLHPRATKLNPPTERKRIISQLNGNESWTFWRLEPSASCCCYVTLLQSPWLEAISPLHPSSSTSHCCIYTNRLHLCSYLNSPPVVLITSVMTGISQLSQLVVLLQSGYLGYYGLGTKEFYLVHCLQNKLLQLPLINYSSLCVR